MMMRVSKSWLARVNVMHQHHHHHHLNRCNVKASTTPPIVLCHADVASRRLAPTHPQLAQLIAHVRRGERYRRRARDVRALQLGHEAANGQRVKVLVLRERGDGVPAEAADERDARRIVRRRRRDGAIEVGELVAVAERRRRAAERYLE